MQLKLLGQGNKEFCIDIRLKLAQQPLHVAAGYFVVNVSFCNQQYEAVGREAYALVRCWLQFL